MRCLFTWRLKCLCPPRNTSRKGKQEKNTRSRASRFRFKMTNGASQCIGCPNIELAAVPTGAATLLGANKWSQRLTLNLENKPAARYTKRRSRWRPAEPILQDPSRYSLKEVPRGVKRSSSRLPEAFLRDTGRRRSKKEPGGVSTKTRSSSRLPEAFLKDTGRRRSKKEPGGVSRKTRSSSRLPEAFLKDTGRRRSKKEIVGLLVFLVVRLET